MGAGQAEEGVVDAQQQKEDEEGVIEEECEEEVEEGEVGCSSLVNCGQCISHPGCVYCRDPDFLLQERSPDLVFLSIISFLISMHLIYNQYRIFQILTNYALTNRVRGSCPYVSTITFFR